MITRSSSVTPIGVAVVSLVLLTPTSSFGAGSSRMYGKGAPFQVTDLPAQSRLRRKLEALSPPARQRAMRKLQEFEFPESDTAVLDTDPDGGVFYVDTVVPASAGTTTTAAVPLAAAALPAIDVFKLHSKPGASRIAYLDFDGHIITGTAWNSDAFPTFVARAFSADADFSTFSASERSTIHESWHRIAEDYAPFDIDITTEQPASFGPNIARVLFTSNTDANGLAMPSNTAGGVAYVNVWGLANYATTYQPALIYTDNLLSHPPYMAEAGAHEFGHNLGLSHDGVVDGTVNNIIPGCVGSTGYYCGLGSGLVSWGPIMGVGYYTNVTQWSKGEYPSANNLQDDVAIISSKLLFRADDRGNNASTATPLVVDATGVISATTPQNDPNNTVPGNKGIIETPTDADFYSFDAAAGPATITAKPAWEAFTRTGNAGDKLGANLDLRVTLYDATGTNVVVESDPLTDTQAGVSATLSAGRYYLAVRPAGNSVTPYSSYNSMGQYYFAGTITPPDTTPPTPNPMSFAINPTAASSTQINMTATTATDPNGPVQYQFICLTGGTGCITSAWQASPSYSATGLAASTAYSFTVQARDARGNVTAPAPTAQATTPSAAVPATPSNLSGTAVRNRRINLTWVDSSSNETGFELWRSVNGAAFVLRATFGVNITTATDTGLSTGSAYRYMLRAVNPNGSSAFSNVAGPITAIR